MDILFVLIPLSVVLALVVLAGLWWAVYRGQFEDIEEEAGVFSKKTKSKADTHPCKLLYCIAP